MHITRYTDYALRVLVYLGLKGEELSTIQEIADSYQISKNHLMKIVQRLNASGYLQATRGKNGGVRLNKSPDQINIGQLVRETESDTHLVECFGPANRCVITPACKLKSVFAEALESFFRTLDNYTLADLLSKKASLSLENILYIKDL